MIEVQALCVEKQGSVICVVNELQISGHEHCLIYGANGSGKSTLLRVLSGLEREYSGSCEVSVPVQDRVFVHQSPWLFRGTVMSNAVYGLRAHGHSRSSAEQSAGRWLETFGITGLKDSDVRQLSGGEQRRVALARAFAVEPKLLLLDEPLADMDERGESALAQAIRDSSGTVITTSPLGPKSLGSLELSQSFELS